MKATLLVSTALVIGLCVLPGCGGGGSGAPPLDPNAHPLTGTWKMLEGNSTLFVDKDGGARLTARDDYDRQVTLSGSISTSGYLEVAGKDSSGLGVTVRASFTRDGAYLHTSGLMMKWDGSGTIREYPNVRFKKS